MAIIALFMIAKRASPSLSQIATQREKAACAERIVPSRVMRVAQSAQRLRFALGVAGALCEFQRALVLAAAGRAVALRKMQVAAQVMDARQLAVESVARGQLLRLVERRERGFHGARHPMPGGDADPCGTALRDRRPRAAARARTPEWRPSHRRCRGRVRLRARRAHGGPAPARRVLRRAATGATRNRCAARPLRPALRADTRRPPAGRRRGPGARHAAPHRAPHTSPPRAGATPAARCAAATHRRRRGSARARTSIARPRPPRAGRGRAPAASRRRSRGPATGAAAPSCS